MSKNIERLKIVGGSAKAKRHVFLGLGGMIYLVDGPLFKKRTRAKSALDDITITFQDGKSGPLVDMLQTQK